MSIKIYVPNQKFVCVSMLFVLMHVFALVSCKSSGSKHKQGSEIEGFSANNSTLTKNAAIMMTAYGSTPGMGGMFEQDQENMYGVLADPTANYKFDIEKASNVSHNQLETLIAKAAAKVTADGTLLVFITAHGSPNGFIQPSDQAYATFGYGEIIKSIRNGRSGLGPFTRLVVIISACYSGSWLDTLTPSDDLAKQRLVMTSVDASNLSMIGSATTAVAGTFTALKSNPKATMSEFLDTAKGQSGGALQYNVNDQAILSEPFLSSPIDIKNVVEERSDIKITALSREVDGVGKLYLYASKAISAMFFVDGSNKPYECSVRAVPQPDWPFICVITLGKNSGYLTRTEPIGAIYSIDGKTHKSSVTIQHPQPK